MYTLANFAAQSILRRSDCCRVETCIEDPDYIDHCPQFPVRQFLLQGGKAIDPACKLLRGDNGHGRIKKSPQRAQCPGIGRQVGRISGAGVELVACDVGEFFLDDLAGCLRPFESDCTNDGLRSRAEPFKQFWIIH